MTARHKHSVGHKKTAREKITLACTTCKNRNYITTKNSRNDPDRFEIKKHCSTCNKHTVHSETK